MPYTGLAAPSYNKDRKRLAPAIIHRLDEVQAQILQDPHRGDRVPWARSWLAMLDSTKALAAGLRLRPLEETVRDILVWDATRPQGGNRRAGLTPDREAALLRRWQVLQQTSS